MINTCLTTCIMIDYASIKNKDKCNLKQSNFNYMVQGLRIQFWGSGRSLNHRAKQNKTDDNNNKVRTNKQDTWKLLI